MLTVRRATFYRRALPAILVGALIVFAVALAFWLSRRAGKDYTGMPEWLLPRETAVMATWQDLSRFLDQLAQTPAVREMVREESLGALLLTDAEWRDLQRRSNQPHYRLLSTQVDRFVKKWLGREVTAAIVPPPQSASNSENITRTGVLFITQADIRFEENLAELLIHAYPDLQLETRTYRGQRMVRYNSEKSYRAFTYCRFGNTIVFSLRSPEWFWLEGVVDRKLAADAGETAMQSLADWPDFKEAIDRESLAHGMRIVLAPERLEAAMEALPGKRERNRRRDFWVDYITDALLDSPWGRIDLTLTDGMRLKSFWKMDRSENPYRPDLNAPPFRIGMAESAPVFFQIRSSNLGPALLKLRDRMADAEVYAESVERFEKNWTETTQTDLAGDWLLQLNGDLGLVMTKLRTGLLFPMVSAEGWCGFQSPAAPQRLENLLNSESASRGGFLLGTAGMIRFTSQDEMLHAWFNTAPEAAFSSSPTPSPTSAILAGLLASESRTEPVVCAYIDLQSVCDQLEPMYRTASIWSRSVRKNLERWTHTFRVLRHMRAMLFTATPDEAGLTIQIHIPMDSIPGEINS